MIKNQWYGILPSKAVKPNGITAVKRLNLELAIFRNNDGKLGCVVDQCTHRGAALSVGKVKDNCVQCPFHGIEFNSEGVCQFIPANGKASTEDLTRYNVKSYPIREAHGIIYLWYGDAQPTTETLPFFESKIDESFIFSEIADHWNSHYSRCIENQLDVVHLPFVHHNTIGRGNKTVVNGPKVIFEDEILITSANNEVDLGQLPKPAEACQINETHLEFKFPNVWLNNISKGVKVFIYFAPVDDENTILYIRYYQKAGSFKLGAKAIALLGKFANRMIERQDKRVVITQKPKASALNGGEKLIKGDAPIIKYRQLRANLQNDFNSVTK